jgi:hypothetical protein
MNEVQAKYPYPRFGCPVSNPLHLQFLSRSRIHFVHGSKPSYEWDCCARAILTLSNQSEWVLLLSYRHRDRLIDLFEKAGC